MLIPMQLHDGFLPGIATYKLDSHEILYNLKRFRIHQRIPENAEPLAELDFNGHLVVTYTISGTRRCTQHCKEIRKRAMASPASPPPLDLGVLHKTWEFVRDIEQSEGRTLAPLTGSTLEAQLLVSRVESSHQIEVSDVPIVVREELPLAVPGVSDYQWRKFKRVAFL